MLQQVMTAPGQIMFVEKEMPQPGPGEVLLKIMKIGVCGSDIHVYHGKHPFTSYPVTQGHEVSARIEKVGEGVTDLRLGQKVTVEPQVVCGTCYPCRHGKYNLCEKLKVMGFQTTGMASEYFAVDAGKVTPVPESMTYNETAMLEPLAVTVHAAKRAGTVRDRDMVVLGAGPIGILLMQTLKAMGARRVMITDISDYRLALAERVGADKAVNTARTDFAEALEDFFGPDKADVIYDCAGNDVTMGDAIRCARKGSTIILVAVFAGMANCDLAVLNDHELDLNTSMMYRHEDYLEAIALVASGKVQLQPLMTRHFAFRDYLAAYQYIDENREQVMKVLIDVDPSEA
ncbi:MAG: alcohol dehydrogenase catalytic domain-containing protein [Clostridia bacterium]|nr:alcohol dehydrogenase catalytic domain-containing protein [Clostridia bacterium]